jgi:alkanesulfonate monooxygenase SsuD/methylene tetrahydromethanopterin reductase-like flavin-dependent oxidoreductase (luciferase family)
MTQTKKPKIAIMYRREYPPEELPAFAQRAEKLGFDQVWVVEDCFFTSGIASAAAALASTTRLEIGLGILPAVARNPVFAAMELATLSRLFPGRFYPGFGHGVAEWMKQIGALPASQLRALGEVTQVVRQLLAGEEVTFHGSHVNLEHGKLVLPPVQAPPIALGVINAKSLDLAGQVADGVILAEFSAPAYIAWAQEQIAAGKRAAGRSFDHSLAVYAIACVDTSAARACARMRPLVAAEAASGWIDAKLAAMGVLPQIRAWREQGGPALLEAQIPDAWISQMMLCGTRSDWQTAIDSYAALGVDTVVLTPPAQEGFGILERYAANILG